MTSLNVIEDEFRAIQDHISAFLTALDGRPYREDVWTYDRGEGGGRTRIWEGANVFEKGGVNFSAIRGAALPSSAATQFRIPDGTPYAAASVSLVMHPWNPHVPTIHMNIRYFEAGETAWFGGGVDLTPYYPVRADVITFHRALRALCVEHGRDYAELKAACDAYFFLPHRGETRGVGGIFFDHLRGDRATDLAFTAALGRAFTGLYGPIVEGRRDTPHTEAQRAFQLLRRGRYAEFNLVYDRGTRFGLQSGGRIESILMSLPPAATWAYDWRADPGTPEAELSAVYLTPRDWADMEFGDGAAPL